VDAELEQSVNTHMQAATVVMLARLTVLKEDAHAPVIAAFVFNLSNTIPVFRFHTGIDLVAEVII
jgi:hypothetical protein